VEDGDDVEAALLLLVRAPVFAVRRDVAPDVVRGYESVERSLDTVRGDPLFDEAIQSGHNPCYAPLLCRYSTISANR
jgi:hypothetical protein